MRHFNRVMDGVDVAQIMAELAAHPELWDANTIRKTAPGTPHSGMSDIWVRYRDVRPFEATGNYAGFNSEHVPINYPAWHKLPSLQDVIFRLMAQVRGEMIGGVLITRIEPGKGIGLHADDSWHVRQYEKFYLSLQSSAGARFICAMPDEEPEALEPGPGEIWLFDNKKPHAVVNESCQDRITAIICIRTAAFGAPT